MQRTANRESLLTERATIKQRGSASYGRPRQHKQVKRLFDLIAIMQTYQGWWTVTEVYREFRSRVSTEYTRRTIQRDMQLLHQICVLERFPGSHHTARYRFAGYPIPIH